MEIKFGTSEAGGTFHSQAVALAALFNQTYPALERCVVTTNLITLSDVALLETGTLDFGLMASNWIGRAADGTAPFAHPIALRMVAPANAGPVFFVTLAGSPIKTVSGLMGKRVGVGPKGSGMAQHAEVILDLLGISFDRIAPVYLGFDQAGGALIRGEIDALWQRPIPNQAMTALSERADVRIVRYDTGQLERIVSQVPFYRRTVVERAAFRGVSEDSPQVGVVNLIVTHERVAEEDVYAMAKVLVENLDTLPEINPLFKTTASLYQPLRTQGSAAFEFAGVPLHTGAQRALRDAGWLG
jgi:TRAP transporter TAXI family solute receptor